MSVAEDEKFEKLDYVNITEEQKVAVKECAKILKEMNLDAAAEEVLLRIGIEVPPEYDIKQSEVVTFLKENGLGVNIQGHILDEGIRYPLISIFADIRQLEETFLKYRQQSKRFWK